MTHRIRPARPILGNPSDPATPGRIIKSTVKGVYASTSMTACLEILCHGIEDIAGPDYISCVILDRETRRFFSSYVHVSSSRYEERFDGQHHKVARPDGWSYRMLQTGESNYFPDTRLESSINPETIKSGTRATAMFPLFASQSPVGAIFINHSLPHAFKNKQIENVGILLKESVGRLIQVPSPSSPSRADAFLEEALILSGDPRIHSAILQIIASTDLAPRLAKSLSEAFETVKTHHPIIAFIDEKLQDGGGLEFGEALINLCLAQHRPIPALILMADDMPQKKIKKIRSSGFLGGCRRDFADNPSGILDAVKTARAWHHSMVRVGG